MSYQTQYVERGKRWKLCIKRSQLKLDCSQTPLSSERERIKLATRCDQCEGVEQSEDVWALGALTGIVFVVDLL